MKKKYQKIKQIIIKQSGITHFQENMIASHFICKWLSKFFSIWFINHKVKPNTITLMMIIFGIVGSILFAIPNIFSKFIGYMFWILWFTMDLSDGEVARYTKTFSKYGMHLDYIAHLVDHPAMTIAIWLTLIQTFPKCVFVISLCIISVIAMELINRNLIAFKYLELKYSDNTTKPIQYKSNIIKYIFTQLLLFPNVIVVFSWIIIAEYYLKSEYILYILLLWVIYFILISLYELIKVIKQYYYS